MDKNKHFLKEIEQYFAVKNIAEGLMLETWTEGGVRQVHILPEYGTSYLEDFKKTVSDFSVIEEIKIRRLDQKYKDEFKIEESFNDFENYKSFLITTYQAIEKVINYSE